MHAPGGRGCPALSSASFPASSWNQLLASHQGSSCTWMPKILMGFTGLCIQCMLCMPKAMQHPRCDLLQAQACHSFQSSQAPFLAVLADRLPEIELIQRTKSWFFHFTASTTGCTNEHVTLQTTSLASITSTYVAPALTVVPQKKYFLVVSSIAESES